MAVFIEIENSVIRQLRMPKQLEGKKIKPVAGIERHGHAILNVQRRTTAAHAAAVLDIIDNERARMNQFNDFGTGTTLLRSKQRRRRLAEQTIAQADKLPAYSFAGLGNQTR